MTTLGIIIAVLSIAVVGEGAYIAKQATARKAEQTTAAASLAECQAQEAAGIVGATGDVVSAVTAPAVAEAEVRGAVALGLPVGAAVTVALSKSSAQSSHALASELACLSTMGAGAKDSSVCDEQVKASVAAADALAACPSVPDTPSSGADTDTDGD